MRYVLLFLFVGCSQSGEIATLKASLRIAGEEVVAKQDKTIAVIESTRQEIVSQNEQIIDTLKIVEASLVVPKVEPGKEVIKSAPESPAKANTALASVKVATPGTSSRTASDGTRLRWNIENDWNPSILETSAHLRTDHGIETNGMTHQEMADIHADLHDGKPVAMKSKAVRVQGCPGGVCPTNTRRGRGLFGGLFR
jgi:nitrate reductase NapAB chaperone NapD